MMGGEGVETAACKHPENSILQILSLQIFYFTDLVFYFTDFILQILILFYRFFFFYRF